MKRPLPPFGKQLKERMRKGYMPSNSVTISTSWYRGRSQLAGITFPPEASPGEFDWSFLAGQDICLFDENLCDYEKLKSLVVILVISGVKSVGLIVLDHPLQWYVPEVKGVAA